MAQSATKATPVGVATEIPSPVASVAPATLAWPCEVTFYRPHEIRVVLVGAGGTGARAATDIARLLAPGDSLQIVDFDRVEEKNLVRQHFLKSDVGRFKAEVVARRAAGVVGSSTITVEPVIGEATKEVLTSRRGWTLLLGCVDNRAARQLFHSEVLGEPGTRNVIWVDAGNELRGGQVGIAGSWLATACTDSKGKDWAATSYKKAVSLLTQDGGANTPQRLDEYMSAYGKRVFINALAEQVPEILKPSKEEEAKTPDCDMRLDTQSLAANVMAYATLMMVVSRILDGLPIMAGLTFFSTANTMKSVNFDTVTSLLTPSGLLVSTKGLTAWDQWKAIK